LLAGPGVDGEGEDVALLAAGTIMVTGTMLLPDDEGRTNDDDSVEILSDLRLVGVVEAKLVTDAAMLMDEDCNAIVVCEPVVDENGVLAARVLVTVLVVVI